jgi:hypothetical protein
MLEVKGATDEVNMLSAELNQLTKETLAAEQANENEFAAVMRPFAESLKADIAELSTTKDRLLKLASETLRLYGEDSSSAYKLVDTVKNVSEFVRSLEAAAADNARIDLAEERKKKREQQQRAALLRKQQNQSKKIQRASGKGGRMGGDGGGSRRLGGRRSLLPGKNKAYRTSQGHRGSLSPAGGDGASPWGATLKKSPLGPTKGGGNKLKRRSTVKYSVGGALGGQSSRLNLGGNTRNGGSRNSIGNRSAPGANSTRNLRGHNSNSPGGRRQSNRGGGGGGGLLNMLVGHAKDGNWDKVTASSPSAMIQSVREATHESDDDDDSSSSDDDDDWDV